MVTILYFDLIDYFDIIFIKIFAVQLLLKYLLIGFFNLRAYLLLAEQSPQCSAFGLLIRLNWLLGCKSSAGGMRPRWQTEDTSGNTGDINPLHLPWVWSSSRARWWGSCWAAGGAPCEGATGGRAGAADSAPGSRPRHARPALAGGPARAVAECRGCRSRSSRVKIYNNNDILLWLKRPTC